MRHSDRWPSWRLPIVGTKATRFAFESRSESSAAVWTMSMHSLAGRRFGRTPARRRRTDSETVLGARKRAVPHGGHVGSERSVDAATVRQEVAHEAGGTAGLDAQRVVDYQYLPGT